MFYLISRKYFCFIILFLLIHQLPVLTAQSQSEEQQGDSVLTTQKLGEYDDAYFILEQLNANYPATLQTGQLQTPQGALEYFVKASRNERYEEAARVLNLNMVPEKDQARLAPELAAKLYHIIDQRIRISWDDFPDRPDGTSDYAYNNSDPLVSEPRRSMMVGTVSLKDHEVEIRLDRVKAGDEEPVWVFSASTVDNINALYEQYGPGKIDQWMPDWAKVQVMDGDLWKWVALMIAIVLSILIGKGVSGLTRKLCLKSDRPMIRWIADIIAAPVAAVVSIALVYLFIQNLLPVTGPFSTVIYTFMLIMLIASFTWLGMRIIKYISEYFISKYAGDVSKGIDDEARFYLTYVSVARQVLIFVVVLAGVGIVIGQFRHLQSFGISLLASAGVATVVLGIAAQASLGNIIAGIQLAITRPVRIGDSVLYEGNWGWIEDITYTYLVILTWDRRRVVVPLKHFITHTVENWSMKDSHLMKPIYFYTDYRMDVNKFREKFSEVLKRHDKWDQQTEPVVQVTDVKEETLEVRALCSAKDAPSAWELHCDLREEMVRYITELEEGRYLSKRRILVENDLQKASHGNGRTMKERL